MWLATFLQLRMCERIVAWLLTLQDSRESTDRKQSRPGLMERLHPDFLELATRFRYGQVQPHSKLMRLHAWRQGINLHQFLENPFEFFDATASDVHGTNPITAKVSRNSATLDNSQIAPRRTDASEIFPNSIVSLLSSLYLNIAHSFKDMLCPYA